MEIRRGSVWWWNCPEHRRAHIQEGTRPVVVVSNDACNQSSGVVTVVPFTTRIKNAYPQQVPILFSDGVSIALTDQITSIPVEEMALRNSIPNAVPNKYIGYVTDGGTKLPTYI